MMKKVYGLNILATFLFVSFISQAQVSTVFNNVKFNESISDVQEKLSVISNDVSLVKVAKPIFPLSENQEEHLVASMVTVKNGTIDKVVFTFADDKLSYIQAKGNVIKGLASSLESEFETYLDYQIYPADLLFINEKKDVAWLLTPESAHPNLFTWNNPYLSSDNSTEIKYNPSVKIPSFIKMGERKDNLMPLLKKNSSLISVENLTETDSITKTQVNCFGIEYAGFPRKFEARFENDRLNMVWILTGKGEEDRIRKKLNEEYGSALFINDSWEVFNDWTVFLRKDKPEILLLTRELGLMYKKQYSK